MPYPKSNFDERRLKSEVDIEFIDYMDTVQRNVRHDKSKLLNDVRKILTEAHGGGKALTSNTLICCVIISGLKSALSAMV